MEIVLCPQCEMKVVPKSGICPSCQCDLKRIKDVSVNTESSGTDDPSKTHAKMPGKKVSPLGKKMCRTCIVSGLLAILLPVMIVMGQLGLSLAEFVSKGFFWLSVITGLIALVPVTLSPRSVVYRLFCVVTMGIACLSAGLVVNAIGQSKASLHYSMNKNNTKQILLAVHNYYDQYQHLPTDILNESDEPVLSWRVALLPFLGQESLYREFQLNEPWDSETNQKMIFKMPKMYSSAGTTLPTGETLYHRLIGTGTAFFDSTTRLKFTDIPSTSSTVYVVETLGSQAQPWSMPGGVTLDELARSVEEKQGDDKHEYLTGMLDGTVLRRTLEDIRNALSR